MRRCKQEKGNKCGRRDNSYYDRERRVRRWFGEVIITCYQMTGLVEAGRFGTDSAPLFEGSRRWFFCGVRERNILLIKLRLDESGLGCEVVGKRAKALRGLCE